jgi:hypothetical protein
MRKNIFFILIIASLLFVDCMNLHYRDSLVVGDSIPNKEDLTASTTIIVLLKKKPEMINSRYERILWRVNRSYNRKTKKIVKRKCNYNYVFALQDEVASLYADKDKYRFILDWNLNITSYQTMSGGNYGTANHHKMKYSMYDRKTNYKYEAKSYFENKYMKGMKIYVRKLNEFLKPSK